ncbi:zinc-binding dehydrogenase [Streptomyces sp. ACA25]|uniref:zinc-binding dehydrogenase n=1 Tax=Streptomyces sp. ACA25 TaxID=3022596 RepID=UPI002306FD4B|nr:zinc-binding dehydrogenase [Streptomyces sp. ACA25]MDB1089980.1 zinc-binding dehydrogenase [Streptomyces sp. ACA25]
MLAGRLHVRSGEFAVEEVPVPEPGAGEVLVQVRAAGVCMSDVHLIDGTLTPSRLPEEAVTLGHEVAGEVAVLGEGVTRWATGQRVLLHAGEKRDGVPWTRGVDCDGGWAEYALATEDTVIPVPDDLPLEQAAIIPDAVSTPWAAITRTARVVAGRPVGVWGVGGLGTHAVQLLRLVGAVPLLAVDPLPEARARSLEFGADAAFDPADPQLAEQLRAETGGTGLDVAFDFAGVPTFPDQAVRCLGPGGQLILVGLTGRPLTLTESTAFSYFRQQARGHFGSTEGDVRRLLTLVRKNRLDLSRSISDVLPLSEAAEAVHRLASGAGGTVRLILRP